MFCENGADAVSDLPEAVPLCGVELKPIRKALQPCRFSGGYDSVLRGMQGANRLITALVAAGTGP